MSDIKTTTSLSRTIAVCTAHRAERGLVSPIIVELSKIKQVKVKVLEEANIQTFLSSTLSWSAALKKTNPDIVLIPCDRLESLAAVCSAFELGIPIAHFHAGDLGGGTRDDSIRMAISRLSSLMFCETEEARDFLVQSGEEPWRCYVVGSTAFDDVHVPEKKDFLKKYELPETFDIFLYHPDPYQANNEIEIPILYEATVKEGLLVLMYPNGDPGSNSITKEIESLRGNEHYKIIPSFESRNDFLAAIKYCRQLIGNSSSMYYEAPFFRTKTVQVGLRNRDRLKPQRIEPGGSWRIANTLATIDLSPLGREKLLRKSYRLLEFKMQSKTYPSTIEGIYQQEAHK